MPSKPKTVVSKHPSPRSTFSEPRREVAALRSELLATKDFVTELHREAAHLRNRSEVAEEAARRLTEISLNQEAEIENLKLDVAARDAVIENHDALLAEAHVDIARFNAMWDQVAAQKTRDAEPKEAAQGGVLFGGQVRRTGSQVGAEYGCE